MAAEQPYKNVNLLGHWQDGSDYYVHVEFEKLACEFLWLEVYGLSEGGPSSLSWNDIDGEKGDREPGLHGFTLQIDLEGKQFSSLEIVTRHLCDSGFSDNIFLQIPLPVVALA